jgi:uncharacterized YccA/Bax inhibitor family protein
MAGVMTWRSGNPTLQADTFRGERVGFDAERMTIGGTVNKTGMALALLVIAASYVWNRGAGDPAIGAFVLGGTIGGFILAMVTAFKHTWAPYTVPVYAVLEGLALGAISVIFNRAYPGIVVRAVFLTFGTLAAMLTAYRTGLISVTDRFRMGVVAATGGIALFYFLGFILSFFGVHIPLVASNGTFGILFSLFVVAIAALNLVLDFDVIDRGARQGAPKYMEWYGAFALLVTLVWLYLELLRLLTKLQSRER